MIGPGGVEGAGDEGGGGGRPAGEIRPVGQQRQRALEVGRRQCVDIERLQLLKRAAEVARQEQQLARPDPAAGEVGARGGSAGGGRERHRLGGELACGGVRGSGVGGVGGGVKRGRDVVVGLRPGRERGEVRASLGAGGDGGQPPVEVGPAVRRHRLDRRRADQRVGRGDPALGLDDDAGQHRRVQRGPGIVEVIHHRDRVGDRDPACRRHDRQRVGGGRGQDAFEALGQRRPRQRRDLGPGRRHAGPDFRRPERVPARLASHQPGLRPGRARRQQAPDLRCVQWREHDRRSRQQRRGQLAPALRQWRGGDGERVGRRRAARGQQQGQRPAGDSPERESQRLEAALVQPLNIVDRQQHRPVVDAGTQRREHREADRVGGWHRVGGRTQQQGDLDRLQLGPGDAVRQ